MGHPQRTTTKTREGIDSNEDNNRWEEDAAGIRKLIFLIPLFRYDLQMLYMGDV